MSVLFCHIYFMLVGRHGGGKFTQGIFKLNHALNRQSWDYISVSGGSGNTGVGEHRIDCPSLWLPRTMVNIHGN